MAELLAEALRRAEAGEIDLSICYFHVYGDPKKMYVGSRDDIDGLDSSFVNNCDGMLFYHTRDSPNGIISIAEIRGFFDSIHDRSGYVILLENPFPASNLSIERTIERTEETHYWNHVLRVTANYTWRKRSIQNGLDLVVKVHTAEKPFSSIKEARAEYKAH